MSRHMPLISHVLFFFFFFFLGGGGGGGEGKRGRGSVF